MDPIQERSRLVTNGISPFSVAVLLEQFSTRWEFEVIPTNLNFLVPLVYKLITLQTCSTGTLLLSLPVCLDLVPVRCHNMLRDNAYNGAYGTTVMEVSNKSSLR